MEILLIDFKLESDNLFNERYLVDILCHYYTDNEELQSKDKSYIFTKSKIMIVVILLLLLLIIYDYGIINTCIISYYLFSIIYDIYELTTVFAFKNLNARKIYYQVGLLYAFTIFEIFYQTIPSINKYLNNILSIFVWVAYWYYIIICMKFDKNPENHQTNHTRVKYSYKYRTCFICNKSGNNWVERLYDRRKIHINCLVNE